MTNYNNINVDELFTSMQNSIASKPKKNTLWTNVFKMKKDTVYRFRLLPYLKGTPEDFMNKFKVMHINYSWKNGERWWNILSGATFNEPCPVNEWANRVHKNGTPAERELAKGLFFKKGYYLNALVVDDPKNPSNNNKVVILDVGKSINDKIQSAIQGDFDEEETEKVNRFNNTGKPIEIKVGRLMMDLSPEGMDMIVKVKTNAKDLPDYSDTTFNFNSKFHLSDEEIKKAYDSCFDLTELLNPKSYEENLKLFKEQFLCIKHEENSQVPTQQTTNRQTFPSPTSEMMKQMMGNQTQESAVKNEEKMPNINDDIPSFSPVNFNKVELDDDDALESMLDELNND